MGLFLKFDAQRLAPLDAGLADTAKAMLTTFLPAAEAEKIARDKFVLASISPGDKRVPVRNASVKGPLDPGGDWVTEKAGAGAGSIAIAKVPGAGDVTYEVVNFVDGTRTVGEIRDAVSAEFGPVDLAAVAEYLDVLAKAGAISYKR
jgi:hypothetical protein